MPNRSPMAERVVEVNLLNQRLLVRTDEDERYVKEVVDYVNGKIEEITKRTDTVGTLHLAIAAALNIADDYLKLKKEIGERSYRLLKRIEERV